MSTNNKVVMAFGRFQPIHKGHAQVINKVIAHAKKIGAEHQIYASRSEGDKKNPIPYKEKVNHLRSLFPEANIVDDPEAISPHHVLRKLSNQGHKDVTMVVGSDRTKDCLLYTSPSPRDRQKSRMPS